MKVTVPAARVDDPKAVLLQAVAMSRQPVALVDVPSRRLLSVSPVVADWFPEIDLVGRDATDYVVGGPSEAFLLLTAGRLDGYELTRQVRLPAGPEDAYVWIHVVGDERPPRTAVVVVDTEDTTLPELTARSVVAAATVIGTVDDEWRIDRISADVHVLLGTEPGVLYGVSFLTLVHPGDLAELLTGLGHAQSIRGGVSVRLRLCDSERRWRWCRAKVTPLGERPGFAFVLAPLTIDLTGHDRVHDLEHRLARIAHEVHSAGASRGIGSMPSSGDVPDLSKLTSREWQIVMRLQAGERIEQVAKSLHLSPSTVRNHLTAIYRKLGVHGQAELLVLLLSDRTK
jgi:DNA-binding CsgD family transcriptional regulator